MTMRPGWRRLVPFVRVVVTLAALAAVLLIARHVDRRGITAVLRNSEPGWLLLATVLELSRLLLRAILWRISLHVDPPVPFSRLVRYTMAAISASLVTPARAGEALRLWLLRQEHGIPFTQSVGVALGEKVLDGLALLLLVIPLPWLVPDLPPWVARTIEGLAAVAVPGLVVGWWIARRRGGAGKIAYFFGQIRILREPVTLGAAFLACLAAWSLDLGGLFASMRAVGMHADFGTAAFVLLVINAALVVPLTPGNLGTLEAAALLAMQLVQIERPQAIAVALLYHTVQIFPLVVFALFHPRLMVGARSTSLVRALAEAALPPPGDEGPKPPNELRPTR
jgi:glycosyltransferase 2 family protein